MEAVPARHGDSVSGLGFLGPAGELVSVARDQRLVCAAWAPEVKLPAEPATLLVTADGRKAVVLLKDGEVWLSSRGGIPAGPLFRAPANAASLALSPAGSLVAVGMVDGRVVVHDLDTGLQVAAFSGGAAQISALAFDMAGRWLATGSEDCTARIWDPRSGKAVSEIFSHSSEIRHVLFSEAGGYLVTASRDGAAKIWLLFPPSWERRSRDLAAYCQTLPREAFAAGAMPPSQETRDSDAEAIGRLLKEVPAGGGAVPGLDCGLLKAYASGADR
jgi:WD40 repeat protein